MTRARSLWIGWSVVGALVALPLVTACSSASPSGRANNPDAFVPTNLSDAGGQDGGAFGDAGAVGSDSGIASPGGEADQSDPRFAVDCLDGRDQNHFGGVDCSDTSCGAAPSCCVGVGSAQCCRIASAAIALDFACTTGTCDTLAGFTTFGDVGPVRTGDMAYSPESDHGTDSGAILDQAFDARASRLTLTASLAVPDGSTEVDAVAVGLITTGPSAHVVPLAAVVVSAVRGEILLLLGESVAARATAPTDGAFHLYTLTLDPSGDVTATSDGVSLHATVALPPVPVRAAFFGRATNPGSSGTMQPARIGSLSVTALGCDQPTALTRLGAVTIIDHTGAALLDTASDPNVVDGGASTALAFTAHSMGGGGSAIFVAVREADGAYHVRAPASGTQPVVAPAATESLESPALAFDGTTWTLYATRVHAGVRSLVRATSTGLDVLTLGAALDVSIPALTGDVSSPAPVPNSSLQLVVRHQAASTEFQSYLPELVLLTLTTSAAAAPSDDLCGADATCAEDSRPEVGRLYATRAETIAFDADDVDDPAFVFYDHVYRLYYAGRLGSRWSIGLLITADLGYWRPANGGAAILAPDGNGYDAVSVRSPSPLVEDGQLSLYYLGSDGETPTIARAQGGAITP